jgi:hypothetical protein
MMVDESLLTKAGMNRFQGVTGVVLSDDNNFRIGISSGMSPWGDHIMISFAAEGQPTPYRWNFSHFSPAKARVIAQHLLEYAERMEHNG